MENSGFGILVLYSMEILQAEVLEKPAELVAFGGLQKKKDGRGGVREGGGRPKLDTTIIREALAAVAIRDAKLHADAISKKAAKGDVPALKELWDRVIGKVSDNINLRAELCISLDV